jgi:cyclophilin family peptidyl-prolyl cis-trans isomerase
MLAPLLLVLALFQSPVAQAPPSQAPIPPSNPANPIVVVETSLGDIVIELRQDRAPASVANFLEYADAGFYDGLLFHRVLKGFMIQGGGYTPDLERREGRAPIRNEAGNGLRNVRGSVAMARASAIRSSTSEFFINLADNTQLNHRGLLPGAYGYAVFGQVLDGMDVVDRIAAVEVVERGGHEAVPVDAVVIKSIRRKSVNQ